VIQFPATSEIFLQEIQAATISQTEGSFLLKVGSFLPASSGFVALLEAGRRRCDLFGTNQFVP